MKLTRLIATLLLFLSPTAVFAQTFTTTGNTALDGTYGVRSGTFGASTGSLQLIASAWQINQATGAITSAYLGAYGTGLGVTGVGDANGANQLHQIDNLAGYTDFVLLQFNRSVKITGINEALYQLTGITGTHGDFSLANGSSVTPLTWSSTIDLATKNASFFNFSNQTGVSGSGNASGSAAATSAGGSQVWLLSASQLSSSRDDGFKLSSITVTEAPALPEPATWAMLIMGFGAIGLTLRRRERTGTAATA